MKKIIVVIILVVLLVLLAALYIMRNPAKNIVVTNLNNDIVQVESSGDIKEDTIKNDVNKKILYFYHDSFIGYLENNKWNKAEELKLSEIFDNDYYTVYNSNFEKSRATKLQINEGEREEPIYDEVRGEGSFYIENIPVIDSPLAKYGTTNEHGSTILDLPVNLNEELSNSYTRYLSNIEWSTVKALGDEFIYNDSSNTTKNLLSFNADYDVKFVEKSEVALSEDVKDYIDNWIVEKGLKEGMPYTISEYFRCDLNNDGIEDELFNIVSNDAYLLYVNDNGMKGVYEQAEKILHENGSFSLVISKINGKINEIYSDNWPLDRIDKYINNLEETEAYNLTVADLNEDGVYEIIIDSFGLDWWWAYLFTYQNGEYVCLNLE